MIWLLLLQCTYACDSTVSPLSGLRVDTGGLPLIEDGSECYPYSTLRGALDSLVLQGGGRVLVAEGPMKLYLESFTASQPIEIQGAGCLLELSGIVSVPSSLSLINIKLYAKSQSSPLISVTASLSLQSCSIQGFASPLIELQGSLTFQDCQINEINSVLVYAVINGIQLDVIRCSVTSVLGILSWNVPQSKSVSSSVQFQDSTFDSVSSQIVSIVFSTPSLAVQSLSFSRCSFETVKLVSSISAKGLNTSTLNCSFYSSNYAFSEEVDAQTLFEGNTVVAVTGVFWTANDFTGSMKISKTTVTAIVEGMFLAVTNQAYSMPTSHITLVDCSFSDMVNQVFDGPVLRVVFASLEMKRLSFNNLFSLACKD